MLHTKAFFTYGILLNLLLFHGDAVKGALMELKAVPEKCQESDLQECSATAESLIKDPGLFFPDKPSTLDRVCSMWDKLTSCIDNYTKKCYTRSEKAKFDRLFRESITAMTTVCTDQNYRTDYLNYAPCVRRITTEGGYCGFPYQILIEQISNAASTMKQLCCARSKFKTCILTKTAEVCDRNNGEPLKGEKVPIGSAKPMNITTFAQQVVDKSLAFISQQCANTRISGDDCQAKTSVLLLRPNSKGPLNSDENFQADASNPPVSPVKTPGVSATKFQTGQKGDGESMNRISSGESNNQVDFNLPRPVDTNRVYPQTVTGLIPKGTESKGQNDEVKLENGSGRPEFAAKEAGENAAYAIHFDTYSATLILCMVHPVLYLIG